MTDPKALCLNCETTVYLGTVAHAPGCPCVMGVEKRCEPCVTRMREAIEKFRRKA